MKEILVIFDVNFYLPYFWRISKAIVYHHLIFTNHLLILKIISYYF
jgi:hypothetical protein